MSAAQEVFAARNPEFPVTVKITEETLTYVALDENGNKRELPRMNAS